MTKQTVPVSKLRGLKYKLLRTILAVYLASWVIFNAPAALAIRDFELLPDCDYFKEAKRLKEESRYGEALVVLDGAEADPHVDRKAITSLRRAIEDERDSYWRRAKDAVRGAFTGSTDSLESTMGAMTADLFVVGDIRDVIIQGYKEFAQGKSDRFTLALATVGIASTVTPPIDFGLSFLKLLNKAGRLSRKLAAKLLPFLTPKRLGELSEFFSHLKAIAKRGSIATAGRILEHVDDPKDLKKIHQFVEARKEGAFVLQITGRPGVQTLVRGGTEEAEALSAVAKKGTKASGWLFPEKFTLLVRGVKMCHKGSFQSLFSHLLPRWPWVILVSVGWAILELYGLQSHLRRPSRSVPAS